VPVRRVLLLVVAAMLLAGWGMRGASAEAQSARHCATERALGRYPPGCPRRVTPRPVQRTPASPARARGLILRNGCDERLELVLDFRTARGVEHVPIDDTWFIGPGETSGPMALGGRRLALVSDEIYYVVFRSGSRWQLTGAVRRDHGSGYLDMARAPVSIDRSGAYVVTFCRAPGTQTSIPGHFRAYFVWDSDEIIPEAAAVLNEAAANYLRLRDSAARIIVSGHAYVEGPRTDALDISRRRANNVRAYLVSRGVPAASITTEAWGDSRPAVEGQTEDVRVQNRRVEILFGAATPG